MNYKPMRRSITVLKDTARLSILINFFRIRLRKNREKRSKIISKK